MILTWILCWAVAGVIAIATTLVVYVIIHRKARSQPKCLHCAHLFYVLSDGKFECSELYLRPLSKAPVYCKDYVERQEEDNG